MVYSETMGIDDVKSMPIEKCDFAFDDVVDIGVIKTSVRAVSAFRALTIASDVATTRLPEAEHARARISLSSCSLSVETAVQ